MTAKRFKSIDCGLQGQYIKDDGIVLTIDEVVELLNELHEENNELKKELDKLELVNEMLSADFSNSEHELWKENEQLKKEIEDFQTLLASKEEIYLKPVITMIDRKIEEIKPYNSELCRATLLELKEYLE